MVVLYFLPNSERNPKVRIIVFHLDNDAVDRDATQKIMMIARRNYQCFDNYPANFKDVNDELIHKSLLLSTDL